MKKQLMLFAFVIVLMSTKQSNSMQRGYSEPVMKGDFTQHFKNLGIRPDAVLTPAGIKAAHKKSIKLINTKDDFADKAIQINLAKHRLENLCLIRARLRDTYNKKIISRTNTGIFTQQVRYKEEDPIDKLNCTYLVTVYNFERIFGTFLMAGAFVNTFIFCLYRDRIELLLAKAFFKNYLIDQNYE